MTTKTYVDYTTPAVDAAWLNDVDRLLYDILNNPADDAAVLTGLGITASIAELNYVDGVTSAIQTQMDLKAPITNAALVTPNLGTPSAGVLTNCTGTATGLSIGGNAATATTANGVTASLTGLLRADAGVLSVGAPLIAFTTFTASNPTWTPNALTKKIVVMVVGGGSGASGCENVTRSQGSPGNAGSIVFGVTTVAVSGTYAITIGAGSAGVVWNANSGNGSDSTITGTGISTTAQGATGSGAGFLGGNASTLGISGASCIGRGGAGTADATGASAAANTGAGGGAPKTTTAASYNGGGGGSGIIYVWEYA